MPRLPRTPCPSCSRPVALLPTQRVGYGSIYDHKKEPRALVLCPGSMVHVAYSEGTAWQLELADWEEVGSAGESIALF